MIAKLIGSREIGPGTRHFDFEAPDWDGRFTPGQFVSLTANVDGEAVTRAYSIATPPDGHRFGLCANMVPDGKLSPWLFGLKPGDEIHFTGPIGTFTPRSTGAPRSILVATGTGIAPFRSFLLSGFPGDCTLIFGTRHRAGLLYDEEWRGLEQTRHGFTYRPTLTRPDPDWAGRTGRVQAHAIEALGDSRDVDVYICGLKEMVDDLRAQLKGLGLDRKRIVYEKYD